MAQTFPESSNSDARIAEIRLALRDKDFDRTLDLIQQAQEVDPKNEEIAQLNVDIRLQRKEFHLTQAKELIKQGKEAFSSGRFSEAAASFQNAIAYERDNKEVQDLILNERARILLQESLSKSNLPGNMSMAEKALASGDFERALQLVGDHDDGRIREFRQKIMNLQKKRSEALTALSAGNYVDAFHKLEELSGDLPGDLLVTDNLQRAGYKLAMKEGNQALHDGDYPLAEEKFQQALEFQPGDQDAKQHREEAKKQSKVKDRVSQLISRAQTARALGNFQEAIEFVKQALDVSPKDEGVKSLLNLVTEKLQQSKEEKARSFIVEGQKFLDVRQYERAEEKYNEALSIATLQDALKGRDEAHLRMEERKNADAAFQTAKGLLAIKDFEGAKKELEVARQFASDPTQVEAALRQLPLQWALSQAEAFLAGQKYALVIEELEKVENQFPGNPDIARLKDVAVVGKKIDLAEAALGANDYDSALKIIEELKRKVGDGNQQVNAIYESAEHRKKKAADTRNTYQQGASALRVNDFDAAIRFFKAAMDSTTPDTPEYQQALEEYNNALERKYQGTLKAVISRLDAGQEQLKAGNVDAALAAADEAERLIAEGKIKIDTATDELLLDFKGQAQQEKTKQEQVIALITEGKQKLGIEEYEQALVAFESAIQLVGEQPELVRLRDLTQHRRNANEGASRALGGAQGAFANQNYEEAWKQTQIALETDPANVNARNIQQQIIDRLKDLTQQAFKNQSYDDATKYVRQWQAFWPYDLDAVDLNRRIENERIKKRQLADVFKKYRMATSHAKQLRILEEEKELIVENQELVEAYNELKANAEVREEVRRLMEIAGHYEETGYLAKAIRAYEAALEEDSQSRTVKRKLEQVRHQSQILLDSAFEQIEQKMNEGDFDSALEQISRLFRITEDTNIRNQILQWRERAYRFQKINKILDDCIVNVDRYLAEKQYEFARQTLNVTFEQLKEADRQEGWLSKKISDLEEKSFKVDTLSRLQVRVRSLINVAQSAKLLYDYEAAIEVLEQAKQLDPNNQEVLGSLKAVQKMKEETEQIVQTSIQNVKDALKVDDFSRAKTMLSQIPVHARKRSEVRSIQVELDYRERESKYNQYVEDGEHAYGVNDYQAAVEKFKNALSMKPDDPKAAAALSVATRALTKLSQEKAQRLIVLGDEEKIKGNYIAASRYYAAALSLDKGNEEASEKYDKVQFEVRAQRIRRNLVTLVIVAILLIMGVPTFFAVNGPARIAAAFPASTQTSTPTSTLTLTPTLTSTPTSTPTLTPSPTITPSPTFSQGVYPGTFYPRTTISFYTASDPSLQGPVIGAWSGMFYICNRYSYHQQDSYLIAANPNDCGTSRVLGWVNGRFVEFQFIGAFPQELTTQGP